MQAAKKKKMSPPIKFVRQNEEFVKEFFFGEHPNSSNDMFLAQCDHLITFFTFFNVSSFLWKVSVK